MSLTTTDQIAILTGVEAPPSGYGLRSYVKQTATEHAKTVLGTYKTVDPQTSPLAKTYLDRLLNVVDFVNKRKESVFESLEAILVSLYAENGTITAVQNADDAGWEGFLNSNIERAFEIVSEVRQDEKTAYDAI